MLKVEDYGKIRRAHRDGMSIREIARTFCHSRRKIREVLRQAEPQPYTLSQPRPRRVLTDSHQQWIDEVLVADDEAPRKQRHTAAQMFRRLRDQQQYLGGYDQVRRYVAAQRGHRRETFLPLSYDPGQRAESDFGHIYVDFPEGRQQVPILLVTWAYSNATFAIALPSEKTEAILHGTVEAFAFFHSVPRELWWDNPKTVAKTILRGRQRELNPRWQALASHYNFEPLFCLPARGNEKPHVENRVKLLERQWATPVPRVKDRTELNLFLRRCCEQDGERTIAGQSETIGERFRHDQQNALPLPEYPFEAAVSEVRKVDKYQTVTWEKNYYSVPRRHAFQTVTVKAYVDRLEVVRDGQIIAQHERCYGQGEQILDPLHYLAMLGRKPAYLDHTDVYRDWRLPTMFRQLREHFEARHGRLPGARHYIRVLQLLAVHPLERIKRSIGACYRDGVVTAERITQRAEHLASLDATRPQEPSPSLRSLPAVNVPRPDLSHFDSLLSQGGENH
ncbi:MAG: IS21 family transposase, partial [Planctomycetes bacterium]|nr:IS21 family transposase [Planctomycetota bacterium]